MNQDVKIYHDALSAEDLEIAELLHETITAALPKAENKVWHGHPVWFIDGNPITGYDRLKKHMRLMFWSGQSFDEPGLVPGASGKFKDAAAHYNSVDEINVKDLKRWLKKSKTIQWDYKNIVKRKGVLEGLS